MQDRENLLRAAERPPTLYFCVCVCVTSVTCEVRVCGLRCRSGSRYRTLAKDQFPHARVRVEVRTREGAFLKVFWYREFRTLDITLSKFEESA